MQFKSFKGVAAFWLKQEHICVIEIVVALGLVCEKEKLDNFSKLDIE